MAQWLHSIPLSCAKYIAGAFFVLIIVWAISRPKEYILKGSPDRKWWRDLRLWAAIILVVQIVLYAAF
jgi:heme A synthase